MTTFFRARLAALSAILFAAAFSFGCGDSATDAPTRFADGSGTAVDGDSRTVALDAAIRKAANVRADVEKRTRENERLAVEAQTRLRQAIKAFQPSERDAILADFKAGKLTGDRADRADVVRAFGYWNEALERNRAAEAARAELARFETALARAQNERDRLARENETSATASNETAIFDELSAFVDVAGAESLAPTDVLDADAADELLESLASETSNDASEAAALLEPSDVLDAEIVESPQTELPEDVGSAENDAENDGEERATVEVDYGGGGGDGKKPTFAADVPSEPEYGEGGSDGKKPEFSKNVPDEPNF